MYIRRKFVKSEGGKIYGPYLFLMESRRVGSDPSDVREHKIKYYGHLDKLTASQQKEIEVFEAATKKGRERRRKQLIGVDSTIVRTKRTSKRENEKGKGKKR